MVKTPRFHCRGRRFNPWLGTKVLHAILHSQKIKKGSKEGRREERKQKKEQWLSGYSGWELGGKDRARPDHP